MSILDQFGAAFTLLDFGGAPGEGDRLESAARAVGLPFKIVGIDDPDAALLYKRNFVLVRPDLMVAWRGDRIPDDPQAVLDRVRGA
ncbi:MAG: hypothetical protein O3A84_08475 [Proteobacteria bacterium]|nr:hypothetical protein [Pseudomonadota bacterium]